MSGVSLKKTPNCKSVFTGANNDLNNYILASKKSQNIQ